MAPPGYGTGRDEAVRPRTTTTGDEGQAGGVGGEWDGTSGRGTLLMVVMAVITDGALGGSEALVVK